VSLHVENEEVWEIIASPHEHQRLSDSVRKMMDEYPNKSFAEIAEAHGFHRVICDTCFKPSDRGRPGSEPGIPATCSRCSNPEAEEIKK